MSDFILGAVAYDAKVVTIWDGFRAWFAERGLPFDYVKIDKSFIDRIASGGGGLVRGIISLAHELGKSVVAEGIETPEQEAALFEFGCDYGQGWLFGKPVDAPTLERSLRR